VNSSDQTEFLNKDIEKERLLSKEDHEAIVDKFRKEYIKKLERIEKIHQQQIEAERNALLNSWRWRIGDVIVSTVLAFINFFKRILRIISGKKYKIHNSQNSKADEVIEMSFLSDDSSNDKNKATLACIFDTFTFSCFKPEFNIISPYPDNWEHIINKYSIDAFFCESAWRGNNSAWRFYIGKIGDLKKKGLKTMVEAYKAKGVPTIFWNKEDPVHFDHFIDDARYFDFIFTTDQDCIPKYQNKTGHTKIYPLPFAAQEKTHNPIGSNERTGKVCFAGTWYSAKYAERILDMEMILKPAMGFGLDIFDRNYGARGHDRYMYEFPEAYKPYIRGKLEYHDMIRAYKQYKVFLNINSVRYSPTMFSRRVFELLACGTPVISTYSEGILNLLGENTVLFAESEEDTKKHIERLLNDEIFWWKQSLNGIRTVMENHTYRHRTTSIFEKIGLTLPENKMVLFSTLCKINFREDALYIISLMNKQVYKPNALIFITDKNTLDECLDIPGASSKFQVKFIIDNKEAFSESLMNSPGTDYYAILDKEDFYGKNYFRDFALAIKYSNAKVIDKRSFIEFSGTSAVVLKKKGDEYQYHQNGCSHCIKALSANLLNNDILFKVLNEQNFTYNQPILSIDPWNFIRNGRHAHEESKIYCQL